MTYTVVIRHPRILGESVLSVDASTPRQAAYNTYADLVPDAFERGVSLSYREVEPRAHAMQAFREDEPTGLRVWAMRPEEYAEMERQRKAAA